MFVRAFRVQICKGKWLGKEHGPLVVCGPKEGPAFSFCRNVAHKNKGEGVALHLRSLLQCTHNEARVLLTLHPLLEKQSPESMTNIVKFLIEKRLTLQQIMSNPWLLLCTDDTIGSKLDIVINKVGGVKDGTVPLLALPIEVLLRVADSYTRDRLAGHPDRIDFLVDQLECSESTLALHLAKHTNLLLLDFNRLRSIMQLLKTNGVSTKNILNDLWIFRHNQEKMVTRLEMLNELAVTDLRPWMLRCPQKTLDNFLDKWKQHRLILQPHRDMAEYLADRLNCSVEDIRTDLVERNPVLLSTSPVKVKQVLDWLFERGFTAQDICDSPRIFEVSMDSLQTRFHQLQQCNYRPRNLHILWVEWKVFDRQLRRLKEEKKKKRKHETTKIKQESDQKCVIEE